MKLTVGQSLMSLVDMTTLIVVRCPDTEVSLTCGGHEMIATQTPPPPRLVAAEEAVVGQGHVMGKRYTADDVGLELLCVRPGSHPVKTNGVPLVQKNAKPLPASD